LGHPREPAVPASLADSVVAWWQQEQEEEQADLVNPGLQSGAIMLEDADELTELQERFCLSADHHKAIIESICNVR